MVEWAGVFDTLRLLGVFAYTPLPTRISVLGRQF